MYFGLIVPAYGYAFFAPGIIRTCRLYFQSNLFLFCIVLRAVRYITTEICFLDLSHTSTFTWEMSNADPGNM